MENLEYKINEIAFETAQFLDKTEINKLLGVLASDGVYAMWVWAVDKLKKDNQKDNMGLFIEQVFSLSEFFPTLKADLSKMKEINDKVKEYLKENLNDSEKKELKKRIKERNQTILKTFQKLSQNMDELLFFKEILERVLILARYHAKAMGEE